MKSTCKPELGLRWFTATVAPICTETLVLSWTWKLMSKVDSSVAETSESPPPITRNIPARRTRNTVFIKLLYLLFVMYGFFRELGEMAIETGQGRWRRSG